MVIGVSTTSPRLRKSCRIKAGVAVQPAGSSSPASLETSGRLAFTLTTTSISRAPPPPSPPPPATTRTPGTTATDSAGRMSTRRATEPYGNRGTDPVTGTVREITAPSTRKATFVRNAALRHGRCRSAESATW